MAIARSRETTPSWFSARSASDRSNGCTCKECAVIYDYRKPAERGEISIERVIPNTTRSGRRAQAGRAPSSEVRSVSDG